MTSSMGSRLTGWWNRFWFSETDPRIYAGLRILFGLLGLISLLGLLNLPLFWRCDGLTASRGDAVCQYFEARGLGWLPGSATLGLSALSFLAMAAGLFSRVATVAAFASMYLLARWNALPLSAAHQVLRCMLFCLIWADTGRVWSVDAWWGRRRGRPARSAPPLIWPQQLIRIQVAAIYLVTGLWKLNNVLWRDGSALHYVYENHQFRRFAMPESGWVDATTTLATYLTLAWELTFSFLVMHRRTRRVALALGVAIHLGMWLTLELGPFSWIMLASYVAFLEPNTLARRTAEGAVPAVPAFPEEKSSALRQG
jgi:hypothetical protein